MKNQTMVSYHKDQVINFQEKSIAFNFPWKFKITKSKTREGDFFQCDDLNLDIICCGTSLEEAIKDIEEELVSTFFGYTKEDDDSLNREAIKLKNIYQVLFSEVQKIVE